MAKVLIIALLPLLKFGLPQSEGQEVSIEKKQADEIIEAGYAKLVSDVKAEQKAKEAEEKAAAETNQDK